MKALFVARLLDLLLLTAYLLVLIWQGVCKIMGNSRPASTSKPL